MLFLRFLWAFFHLALSPSVWSSHMWPPVGIVCVNPLGIPLLNTLLLVRRGVTLTWGHHLVIRGQLWESLGAVAATCLLGLFFLLNQVVELVHCPFTIRDRRLGRVFFTLTGFHGFHVLVGVVLLIVRGVRLVFYHFRALNHAFFEISI
jgi:heme/copper-type cytochrome/quinol oxidase subunit 3